MQLNKSKIIVLIFAAATTVIGLRTCYYGSTFRSCIYTEQELPMAEKLKKSKIFFTKSAVIISNGSQEDFSCLLLMGSIPNKIIERRYAYIYKEGQQRIVNPSDDLEMEIIKIVAVTKHGITTIDSGSGPLTYLILRDKSGVSYKVPTVGLGINDGDEFLKAVSENEEFILKPSFDFTK